MSPTICLLSHLSSQWSLRWMSMHPTCHCRRKRSGTPKNTKTETLLPYLLPFFGEGGYFCCNICIEIWWNLYLMVSWCLLFGNSLPPFQELGELVPRYMQGPNRNALEDARRLKDLRSKASNVLGKGHWTYFLATFAWLQKCLRKQESKKVNHLCAAV